MTQYQPYPQQPGPPSYYYPGHAAPQDVHKHSGLATAALVLGIIGFVFACIPFLNFVAYPIVVLAVVFGVIGITWGKGKAGLILGVLGLIATILWTVFIAGAFDQAAKDYKTYSDCMNHASTAAQIDDCDNAFGHS